MTLELHRTIEFWRILFPISYPQSSGPNPYWDHCSSLASFLQVLQLNKQVPQWSTDTRSAQVHFKNSISRQVSFQTLVGRLTYHIFLIRHEFACVLGYFQMQRWPHLVVFCAFQKLVCHCGKLGNHAGKRHFFECQWLAMFQQYTRSRNWFEQLLLRKKVLLCNSSRLVRLILRMLNVDCHSSSVNNVAWSWLYFIDREPQPLVVQLDFNHEIHFSNWFDIC